MNSKVDRPQRRLFEGRSSSEPLVKVPDPRTPTPSPLDSLASSVHLDDGFSPVDRDEARERLESLDVRWVAREVDAEGLVGRVGLDVGFDRVGGFCDAELREVFALSVERGREA